MKRIIVFTLVFLIILIVNGNATDSLDLELFDISSYINPYGLGFLDETSSVEGFYNTIISITSWSELKQGWLAIAEPISMLILGTGLLGLGELGRKRLKK